METTTINKILSQYDFHKDQQNNFIKKIDNRFFINATINGKGIILHLVDNDDKIVNNRMTIQADTEEDFATAYSDLMEVYNNVFNR